MQLTQNFKSEEFQCPCCHGFQMDGIFLVELQRIRSVIGKPFIIRSGYRCQTHNRQVSGGKFSKHLIGMAADIDVTGWKGKDIHDLIDEISSLINSGLGIYSNHIHFDLRDERAAWFA